MDDVRVFASMTQAGRAAAATAVARLGDAIDGRAGATWILAGGSSPEPGYRAIVDHHASDLAWQSDVVFLMGDERCVAPGSKASNWQSAVTTLLDPLGVPERNRVRPPAELGPTDGARSYRSAMAEATPDPTHPTWDHIWLGVGADGHTLSLFPGAPELRAQALVTGVEAAPATPPQRITMTLTALAGVRTALVVAGGRAKAGAVARALAADRSLPVTRATDAIRAGGGSVTWIIDRDAASQL